MVVFAVPGKTFSKVWNFGKGFSYKSKTYSRDTFCSNMQLSGEVDESEYFLYQHLLFTPD